MYLFLNDAFVPEQEGVISPYDRGLSLGDGFFETMRSLRGDVLFFSDHFERLQSGCNFLSISFPYSEKEMERIIQKLLVINHLNEKEAAVRLTVTRGCGPRGLAYPKFQKPTVLVTAFPYQRKKVAPLRVCISPLVKNERSPLSKIKSLNFLEHTLAYNQALEEGFDDALLLNTKGFIAEACFSNVFFLFPSGLTTPPLEDGALPGVMRKQILSCKELSCVERSVSTEELSSLRGLFLCNVLRGLIPVGTIG